MKGVLEFFETAGRNILAAEAAGVRHHIARSVAGTDRMVASDDFRAKMAQENLIKAAKIPTRLCARLTSWRQRTVCPSVADWARDDAADCFR